MIKKISDAQAQSILSTLDVLMETDIAVRSGNIERIVIGDLTTVIISLVESFSFSHPEIEKSFVNDNLRDIAMAKKEKMIAEEASMARLN